MKKIAIALAGILLTSILASGAVHAQSKRQEDKNNMRNLSTVLGALAVHKASKGDNQSAIALGIGAAYSAKKYEDQRQAQKTSRRYRYSHKRKVGYWLMRGNDRIRYVSY